MKELRLDWRGNPDLSKPCDLYSVAATHEKRPVTGNPQGRILVGISPTIYFHNGIVSDRPYNLALYQAANKLQATTQRVVWRGDNGGSTELFDLTKRGMLKAWLEILDQHFPWADGFHVDYFSAWSWLFPDLADTDQKWDDALAALANALRAKGKIVLPQQFQVVNPVLATNGQFVEQSPFSFRQTLATHDADAAKFRSMMNLIHDKRELLFVFEVREWQNWPASTLTMVKNWAEERGYFLCLGRDANVAP